MPTVPWSCNVTCQRLSPPTVPCTGVRSNQYGHLANPDMSAAVSILAVTPTTLLSCPVCASTQHCLTYHAVVAPPRPPVHSPCLAHPRHLTHPYSSSLSRPPLPATPSPTKSCPPHPHCTTSQPLLSYCLDPPCTVSPTLTHSAVTPLHAPLCIVKMIDGAGLLEMLLTCPKSIGSKCGQ
jgi:hypothetical protein